MESTPSARECVFCFGDIDVRASHCRHCGRVQPIEPSRSRRPWGLWISIAGLPIALPVGVLGLWSLWDILSRLPRYGEAIERGVRSTSGVVVELLVNAAMVVGAGLWIWFSTKMLRNRRTSRDTPSSTTS